MFGGAGNQIACNCTLGLYFKDFMGVPGSAFMGADEFYRSGHAFLQMRPSNASIKPGESSPTALMTTDVT